MPSHLSAPTLPGLAALALRDKAPAATALQLGFAAGCGGSGPGACTVGEPAPSPDRLLLLPRPQAGRRAATGVPLPLATDREGEDGRLGWAVG